MNQLFDFFFTNEKLRWKVYVAAGGASLIYALVNLWVFRRNEERVFSETVWVLVFLVPSIALFAAVYASHHRTRLLVPTTPGVVEAHRSWRWRRGLAHEHVKN